MTYEEFMGVIDPDGELRSRLTDEKFVEINAYLLTKKNEEGYFPEKDLASVCELKLGKSRYDTCFNRLTDTFIINYVLGDFETRNLSKGPFVMLSERMTKFYDAEYSSARGQ